MTPFDLQNDDRIVPLELVDRGGHVVTSRRPVTGWARPAQPHGECSGSADLAPVQLAGQGAMAHALHAVLKGSAPVNSLNFLA